MSAKYLLPRRGSKDIAHAQHIVLKSGELFLEFPTGMAGKEPGRIVVGDGNTQYQNINYASTATDEFQPFITDPSIYTPRFDDSNPSASTAATHNFNASTEAINEIGDGSGNTKLPNIVGAVKKTLSLHNDSIEYLANNSLSANGATMTGDLVFDSNEQMTKLINLSTHEQSYGSYSILSKEQAKIDNSSLIVGLTNTTSYQDSSVTHSQSTYSVVANDHISVYNTAGAFEIPDQQTMIEPANIQFKDGSAGTIGACTFVYDNNRNEFDIYKRYGWGASSVTYLNDVLKNISYPINMEFYYNYNGYWKLSYGTGYYSNIAAHDDAGLINIIYQRINGSTYNIYTTVLPGSSTIQGLAYQH